MSAWNAVYGLFFKILHFSNETIWNHIFTREIKKSKCFKNNRFICFNKIDANSKVKTFTLIFETCSTSTTLQFYDLFLAESFVASPPSCASRWLKLGLDSVRADSAVKNSPHLKADVPLSPWDSFLNPREKNRSKQRWPRKSNPRRNQLKQLPFKSKRKVIRCLSKFGTLKLWKRLEQKKFDPIFFQSTSMPEQGEVTKLFIGMYHVVMS